MQEAIKTIKNFNRLVEFGKKNPPKQIHQSPTWKEVKEGKIKDNYSYAIR